MQLMGKVADAMPCSLHILIVQLLLTRGFALESPYKDVEKHPAFWRYGAHKTLQQALKRSTLNTNRAKNVILFIGDGMDVSTMTAGRIQKGQMKGFSGEETQTWMDQFPYVGLSKIYTLDSQTPDSAGTATALLTGVKTKNKMLGLSGHAEYENCASSKGNSIKTILEYAADMGKHTGVISTTYVTHATPASAYAHSPSRGWVTDGDLPPEAKRNGCMDTASQLVQKGRKINVVLGGGRIFMRPRGYVDEEYGRENDNSKEGRTDGRNLIKEWLELFPSDRARYVWDQKGFDDADPDEVDNLMGLFEPKEMNFEHERNNDIAGEPSIAEMTAKAIKILSKNPNGYFLLVEGGKIDRAHHQTKANVALSEFAALDEAVGIANTMTSEDDTLIVVTADHGHMFNIGGHSSRGNPVTGLAKDSENPKAAADDKPYTTIVYGNGAEWLGHKTNERRKLTREITGQMDFHFPTAIPLPSETHSASDVAVLARGPMSHLFNGVYEQNYVGYAMMYASCLGPDRRHCATENQQRSWDCEKYTDQLKKRKYVSAKFAKTVRLADLSPWWCRENTRPLWTVIGRTQIPKAAKPTNTLRKPGPTVGIQTTKRKSQETKAIQRSVGAGNKDRPIHGQNTAAQRSAKPAPSKPSPRPAGTNTAWRKGRPAPKSILRKPQSTTPSPKTRTISRNRERPLHGQNTPKRRANTAPSKSTSRPAGTNAVRRNGRPTPKSILRRPQSTTLSPRAKPVPGNKARPIHGQSPPKRRANTAPSKPSQRPTGANAASRNRRPAPKSIIRRPQSTAPSPRTRPVPGNKSRQINGQNSQAQRRANTVPSKPGQRPSGPNAVPENRRPEPKSILRKPQSSTPTAKTRLTNIVPRATPQRQRVPVRPTRPQRMAPKRLAATPPPHNNGAAKRRQARSNKKKSGNRRTTLKPVNVKKRNSAPKRHQISRRDLAAQLDETPETRTVTPTPSEKQQKETTTLLASAKLTAKQITQHPRELFLDHLASAIRSHLGNMKLYSDADSPVDLDLSIRVMPVKESRSGEQGDASENATDADALEATVVCMKWNSSVGLVYLGGNISEHALFYKEQEKEDIKGIRFAASGGGGSNMVATVLLALLFILFFVLSLGLAFQLRKKHIVLNSLVEENEKKRRKERQKMRLEDVDDSDMVREQPTHLNGNNNNSFFSESLVATVSQSVVDERWKRPCLKPERISASTWPL